MAVDDDDDGNMLREVFNLFSFSIFYYLVYYLLFLLFYITNNEERIKEK